MDAMNINNSNMRVTTVVDELSILDWLYLSARCLDVTSQLKGALYVAG